MKQIYKKEYKDAYYYDSRAQIKYVIYLKNDFGVYTVYDDNLGKMTICGNTVEPLNVGRVYNFKLVEYFNTIRQERTTEILEAYEQSPESSNELDFLTRNIFKTKNMDEYFESVKKRVLLDEQVEQLVDYKMEWKLAKKFVLRYGLKSAKLVKENPYLLLNLVSYFTFQDCDIIANKLGYNVASPIRIIAAIKEALNEFCNETGFTFCTKEYIVKQAKNKLRYRLTQQECENILKEHLNEKYTTYKVFNFETLIYIDELTKILEEKKEYIFYEISDSEINFEIEKGSKSDELFKKDMIINNKNYRMIQDIVMHQYEQYIASKISKLNKNKNKNKKNDEKKLDILIAKYEQKNNIQLTDEQKEAIKNVLEYNHGGFYLINGNAGTGKTTVVKAILDIYDSMNPKDMFRLYNDVSLLAPTGRAADVLTKAIDNQLLQAETIHKKLQYDQDMNDFLKNEINPLDSKFIIVDETSMLDTWLCYHLLSAVGPMTKVVFLGDDRQLPSVGPGKVLKDLLEKIPNKNTLTVVKRQNIKSGILKNALDILDMKKITSYKDSQVFYENNQNKQMEILNKLVLNVLKTYKNEDICILTPMKIGQLGTKNLNHILQPIFNPQYDKYPHKVEEYSRDLKTSVKNYLCKGDKVINIQNFYNTRRYSDNKVEYQTEFYQFKQILLETKKDEYSTYIGDSVMNGEIGIIDDIRKVFVRKRNKDGDYGPVQEVTRIIVKYPSRNKNYKFEYVFYDDDEEYLNLAYAITVHKSQGSSWPCTINIVNKSHTRLVSNELLYVAATRASEINYFIIDNVYDKKIDYFSNKRQTFLPDELEKEL